MTIAGMQGRMALGAHTLPILATSLAAFTVLVWPRASVVLLLLLALSIWLGRSSQPIDLKNVLVGNAVAVIGLLLVAYLALNATWALDPAAAYEKVMLSLILLATVLVVARLAGALEAEVARRASIALAVAATVAAPLLLFELLTGQALARGLFNLAPVLAPEGSKHLIYDGSQVARIPAYVLNRNAGMFMLLFWPVMLAFQAIVRKRARLGAMALFLACAAAFVLLGEHETSQIALVLSVLAYVAFLHWPNVAWWGLVSAWWASFALVVPLALLLHQAEWHHADWIPETGQARVVLWQMTALKTLDAPILGAGVRSTQAHHAVTIQDAHWPEGYPYPRHMGRHAHNIYLQSWYELGLVGVALLAALGTAILLRLRRLSTRVQPYACAQFVAFMCIAALAWGMWQTWYLAGIAMSALIMRIVAETRDPPATARGP